MRGGEREYEARKKEYEYIFSMSTYLIFSMSTYIILNMTKYVVNSASERESE